ncbi:hypothetical protein B0H16DRAFT_610202 [Mycena metata]|uniref:Secreted protein n=1 Tax=Mycena metata TaxID=1033252 RepID=A0AAD7KBL3_9AGAR|nr:hypothetical protein B0H16DRAFT_610202 [Mycena metata]
MSAVHVISQLGIFLFDCCSLTSFYKYGANSTRVLHALRRYCFADDGEDNTHPFCLAAASPHLFSLMSTKLLSCLPSSLRLLHSPQSSRGTTGLESLNIRTKGINKSE